MSQTPTWYSWYGMFVRCENRNSSQFNDYGGRGIKVCERWRSFENFFADMREKPKGTSLDRINNDGDYKPSNCRWASRTVQNNNSRHNRILTIDGRSMTLEAWSKESGIEQSTMSKRLAAGWPMDLMLIPPKCGQLVAFKRRTLPPQ